MGDPSSGGCKRDTNPIVVVFSYKIFNGLHALATEDRKVGVVTNGRGIKRGCPLWKDADRNWLRRGVSTETKMVGVNESVWFEFQLVVGHDSAVGRRVGRVVEEIHYVLCGRMKAAMALVTVVIDRTASTSGKVGRFLPRRGGCGTAVAVTTGGVVDVVVGRARVVLRSCDGAKMADCALGKTTECVLKSYSVMIWFSGVSGGSRGVIWRNMPRDAA